MIMFTTGHKRLRSNFENINFYRSSNKTWRPVVSIISPLTRGCFRRFISKSVGSPVISSLFSNPRSHLMACSAHYTSPMVTTNCGPLSAFYYRPAADLQ